MKRPVVRWRNVGRAAGAVAAVGLAVVVAPRLLDPGEPPPLPDDVGLEVGATGFAYDPPEPRRPDREPERRQPAPRPGPKPEPEPKPKPRPRPDEAGDHDPEPNHGRPHTPLAPVSAPADPPPPAPVPPPAPAAPPPAPPPEPQRPPVEQEFGFEP
jgi:hypothetical protein